MIYQQISDTTFMPIIIIAMVVLIILTLILYFKLRSGFMKSFQQLDKLDEVPQRYIAIVKCFNNDYIVEKEFQEGDFVGKIVGECPKCRNKLVIEAIFAQYTYRKR
jgi:hypothetical protein